jgi:hypothetical protein
MKIVGFAVDVSRSQDERIVRDERVRQSQIRATLDLIQAGDVEPTSGAIATIAGLPSRTLFQHFIRLSDLYAAAFELAVSRAFGPDRKVDSAAPLASRIALLVSDRAQLFEEWLPVWHFAERVRRSAPAVGAGLAHLRGILRERIAAWFAVELDALDAVARDHALDSLDRTFGLDSWMNMRERQRLSPMHASRTWRFTAEAIVQRTLTGPGPSSAAA